MPYIQITLAAGHTAAEKKKLMAAVTEAVHNSIDVPKPAIRVWLNEIPAPDMSIGGVTLDEVRRMREEGTTDL